MIAQKLGVTRGMVAGKRHSLGLTPRLGLARRTAQAANGAGDGGPDRAWVGKASDALAEKLAKTQARLEGLIRPLSGSNPRPWELREAGECAFPVAGYGPGTLSCCEVVTLGRAYCFGHCEILAGRSWPPLDAAPELAASQYEACGVS